MSSFNPIRRTPLKPKSRQAKQSAPWRARKVRLDAEGMRKLRHEIFLRCAGRCENSIKGKRCEAKVGWFDMHAHHLIHRSLGGSDVEWNLLGVCAECHRLHHAGKQRIAAYDPLLEVEK